MSLKSDVSTPGFWAALQVLDSEITHPVLDQSRINSFEKYSDKRSKKYDPMCHMIHDLLKDTIFFAQDSAGDLFGVYTFSNKEYIVKFDKQDVFLIIGDSISNWAREVYFNLSEYPISDFENACFLKFSVPYIEPAEDKYPNIYSPYFA